MTAKTVRNTITSTLFSFDATFSTSVVEMLAERVEKQNPENPIHFAYVVAHNWAVSQHRSRLTAEKQAPILAAKREREAVAQAKFEAARDEYWTAAKRALAARINPPPTSRAEDHLQLLYLTVFANQPVEELEQLFGITVMTRHKWLQRARKMLQPHASAGLNEVVRGNGYLYCS